MARIIKVLEGLRIIHQYEPTSEVSVQHDEIFAGSEATKKQCSQEESEDLERAGWTWDEDNCSFRKFT